MKRFVQPEDSCVFDAILVLRVGVSDTPRVQDADAAESGGREPGNTRRNGAETYRVPFRLSDTKHLLVRAKINGKGPFLSLWIRARPPFM